MEKSLYSPFTPGLPVPVDLFAERIPEVYKLRNLIGQSANGRLTVTFMSGERGIGKTSLASFVRHLAENEYSALAIHSFLGGVATLEEMVQRVFDALTKTSEKQIWHKKILGLFGKRIKKIGILGTTVAFDAPPEELRVMAAGIVPVLRQILDELHDDKKAIFLVLDDIDGLAGSDRFANWLKSLVDDVATSGVPLPLSLLLVGVEDRRESLIRLQSSLSRVLTPVEIKPWNPQETSSFFSDTFVNGGVTIDDQALSLLVHHAEGLPMLAHELGDATFLIDEDGHISRPDAVKGIIQSAEIVGQKYLKSQVLNPIRSVIYRNMLRKVSCCSETMNIVRGQIQVHLNEKERKVLNSFLKRMKELGIFIIDEEGGPGAYRFSQRLHRLYFRLEAQKVRNGEIIDYIQTADDFPI